MWLPAVSDVTLNTTVLGEVPESVPVPSRIESAKNYTLPDAPAVTVADKLREVPVVGILLELVRIVAVGMPVTVWVTATLLLPA